MRENVLEFLEKEYPKGFVFIYLNDDGEPMFGGHKINDSDYLAAFYHMGMAMSYFVAGGADA